MEKNKAAKKLSQRLKKKPSGEKLIEYKLIKRTIQKDIRNAKSKYYQSKLAQADAKQTWTIINEVLGRTKGQNSIEKLQVDNQIITDQKEIATALNKYYTTVGFDLAEKIPNIDARPDDIIPQSKSNFNIDAISESDVLEMLKSMAAKTSHGFDYISNKLIKMISLSIIHPLTYVINKIFKDGKIPEELKRSNTIFLKKKTNAMNPSEYRPICLVPVLLKLIDKIFSKRLYEYMEENDLWYRSQHAYSARKSTNTALYEILT